MLPTTSQSLQDMNDKHASSMSSERRAYDAYLRDLCQAGANYVTALYDQDTLEGNAAPANAAILASFITRVVFVGSISPPILLAALVYLSRLKARNPSSIGASGARLFLTAIILGQKILQDGPFSNFTWSRIIKGQCSLDELSCMERELLAFLLWDVGVEVDQLLAVEDLVMTHYRRPLEAQPPTRMAPDPAPWLSAGVTSTASVIVPQCKFRHATTQLVTSPAAAPRSATTTNMPQQTPVVSITSLRPRAAHATMLPLSVLPQLLGGDPPAAKGHVPRRHRRAAYPSPLTRKMAVLSSSVRPSPLDAMPFDRPPALGTFHRPFSGPPVPPAIVTSRSTSAICRLAAPTATSPITNLAVNFSRPGSRARSAAELALLEPSHDVTLQTSQRRAAPPLTHSRETANSSSSSSSSPSSLSGSSAASSALLSPIGQAQTTAAGVKPVPHQSQLTASVVHHKVGSIFSFGLLRGWRSTTAGQPIATACGHHA